MVFARLENLKERIHSFRLPIRNKKVLFLVQCCYLVTPVILGMKLMEWIQPDPDELRRKVLENATPEQIEQSRAQGQGIKEALAAAKAAADARKQQN